MRYTVRWVDGSGMTAYTIGQTDDLALACRRADTEGKRYGQVQVVDEQYSSLTDPKLSPYWGVVHDTRYPVVGQVAA